MEKMNKVEKMMNIVLEACMNSNIKPLCVDKLDFTQMRRLRDKTIERNDCLLYSISGDFFMYKALFRTKVSENVCNRNKKTLQQSFKKQQKYNIELYECKICCETSSELIQCPTCDELICFNCGDKTRECPYCKSAKKDILSNYDEEELIYMFIKNMEYGHFIWTFYASNNKNWYKINDKNI